MENTKREAVLAYNREYARRPDRIIKSKAIKDAIRQFKYGLLNQFVCHLCDNNDPDLVQWHHVDPTEKLFDVSNTTRSHEIWWDEVLKCVPLCANCHVKIHKNKLCLLPQTFHSE